MRFAKLSKLYLKRTNARSRKLQHEVLELRQLLAASGLVELAEGEPLDDFSLVDVNPTSETFNQTVSPRDYIGQTSAWYFGHST